MKKENEIIIRKANIDDVEEIFNLLADVHSKIENKSWYTYTKKLERYELFINDGYCIVACDKEKIVGAYLTYILRDDGTEFYQIIKEYFKDTDNIIEAINAAVSEEYRGIGIQTKMMKEAEKMLEGSKYKRFVSTVHPENIYSLNNLKKLGYKVALTTKLYGRT